MSDRVDAVRRSVVDLEQLAVECERMARLHARVLAAELIARIQDQSKFYHFWHHWK